MIPYNISLCLVKRWLQALVDGYVDDIFLVIETRMGINRKLEFCKSTLESESIRLSRSKMEYIERPFSHNRNKDDSYYYRELLS